MPTQPELLHRRRTQIQNRLKIRYIAGFFISILGFNRCAKKVAGWHLFGVAYYDQLFCSIDCADCVLWKNLRRLIKYNYIKVNRIRGKKCTDA